MNKIVLLTLLFVSLANAKFINGLVATVENQPITDYELNEAMAQTKLNRTQAINFLIRQKLEEAQISALNITASDQEIKDAIEKIAQTNKTDAQTLQNYIKSQGIDYENFENNIKKGIQKEKLYERILSNANKNITPQNARKFYESNQQLFLQFEEIEVTHYSAASQALLQKIIQSPLSVIEGVETKNLKLHASSLNNTLMYVFINSKDGDFTPIIQNNQGGFDMFYIISRSGAYLPPFESVEEQVVRAIIAQEKDIHIADYFNKLRAKANVEIIR